MKCKLSEIAIITMGQSPKGSSYNANKEGKPFLQGRKTFGRMYPYIDTWTTEPNRMAQKGSILMSVRAPVGDVNIANNEICIGRGLCSINAKNGNNNYLYYLLLNGKANIVNKSSGTVFDSINREQLENLEISAHNEDEQRKISRILSKIDEKIELNTHTNNNLLEIINCLYKDTFESIKGFDKAENIANITIGKTPPRSEKECFTNNENDMKWISISDLGKSGTYIFNTTERLTLDSVNKYNVKVIPKDTIILSFKLTVGRIAITTEDMTTNEAIAHFNLKNNDMKYYLYSYFKNFDYAKLGSTSSIATAVNSKIIKAMPIGIPSEKMLKEYNNKVHTMYEKILENEKENQNLEQLRDTLLPKLMNGEIDLDKVEI